MKGKLHRPSFDGSPEGILKLRAETETASVRFGKLPQGSVIEAEPLGNIHAEWLRMPGNSNDKAILYFHGGMYLIGSAKSHRMHVIKFVERTGLDAFVFDYRLAPEHPFPAALDDAVSAYRHLLSKGYQPENIVFAGDSAGGGLLLATLLAIKQSGNPLPAAAAALSPWTDLTLSGDSYRTNLHSCVSPPRSAEISASLYTNGHNAADPLVSPLFGDLKGLPPLHLSVGNAEILLDDSRRFAKKAQQAGVNVHLLVGEGMCHCFPAFGPLMPESDAAIGEITLFLRKAVFRD